MRRSQWWSTCSQDQRCRGPARAGERQPRSAPKPRNGLFSWQRRALSDTLLTSLVLVDSLFSCDFRLYSRSNLTSQDDAAPLGVVSRDAAQLGCWTWPSNRWERPLVCTNTFHSPSGVFVVVWSHFAIPHILQQRL